jgi:hypothetical protein
MERAIRDTEAISGHHGELVVRLEGWGRNQHADLAIVDHASDATPHPRDPHREADRGEPVIAQPMSLGHQDSHLEDGSELSP